MRLHVSFLSEPAPANRALVRALACVRPQMSVQVPSAGSREQLATEGARAWKIRT
ncbi:hypothetical protein DPMN_021539 [Dreissena polymorpha]|uniref:Uncharacterized protein n=1 Tax=Dreissena polymorpha TaxID=45954 RepID=A0A9D4NM77_DREPO|nr:hypothetical protein DPMN_021539 [Dreissena polymorpha]